MTSSQEEFITETLDKNVNCQYCNKVFKKSKTLQTHQRKFHKIIEDSSSPLIYKCDECNKVYKHKSSLLCHAFTHNIHSAFKCTENDCERLFKTPKRLKEHQQRAHASLQRQFICEYCGYQTRLRSNLGVHISLHTGKKHYSCELCGKQFSSHCALVHHCSSVHADRRAFKCSTCGLSFFGRDVLKRHSDLHKKFKKYHCKICTKAFTQQSGLSQHKRVHKR